MLRLKRFSRRQIKLIVIALTIILSSFAVFKNATASNFYFGNIFVIWWFVLFYIVPYIENKDMGGWMACFECKEENYVFRLVFVIFAVIVCIVSFYLLF